MAYSWQQNQTNEKGKYSWQNGGLQPTLEEKVKTEKEGLIKQGLPVSVRKDRATPTMGGSLIRSAIMPVADIAKNLTLGANLDNKYLGKVEGLGQADLSKMPWEKENLKVIAKSAATGLELGSYATGGSAVVGAGKNVAKQTAKEFLKTSGKQLAKEGAITSGLGSIGYQGREGKIDPLQVIRDTTIGAVAAPLLGVGFNKLLGKKAGNVVDEIPTKKVVYSGEPVTKETVGGTKFFTPNKEVATKYADINKDVTGKSQVVEKDITGLNLKKVTQAEMQDAVEDPAIKQNYDGIEFQVAGEKEPSYAIFDKPKEVIGNKPSIESTRLNENLVKQGFDELPAEQKATYNAFQVKEQTDKITQQLDTNYDGFKQSVLDNKIPSDIQPTMAFNAIKNKAIQEGDFETQRLLAKSPLASLSSQAGSTLRATQEFSIDGADSVTIMQKLNQELEKTTEKKLGKSIKQAKQELANNAEQIFKSEIKKITSKQSVADFINSIPDC
jgi:hypothetical protein